MSETARMKGNEFIRQVKKLAKKRGVEARVDKKRGKGSHVTLYFGDKVTIAAILPMNSKLGLLKLCYVNLG